jgi:hypothetical protein
VSLGGVDAINLPEISGVKAALAKSELVFLIKVRLEEFI